MAYDKNVFVLGAGASVGAGAPVLNDFLRRARDLLDNQHSLLNCEERKAFERIFQWRYNIAAVRRYMNIDLENVEELFSLVDMSCQLDFKIGEQEAEETRKDLTLLISRTLELTIKFRDIKVNNVNRYSGDQTYYEFANLLSRWSPSHNKDKSEFDSIITLNYDTALDRTLSSMGRTFTYCTPWSKMKSEQYKLLKLHGSINWGICQNPKCNMRKEYIRFQLSIPNTDYHTIETTRLIYKDKCKCGASFAPFIVPPT